MISDTAVDIPKDKVRLYSEFQAAKNTFASFSKPYEVKFIFKIDDLGEPKFKLNKPIFIWIEGNEDGFAGFYRELNIYTFNGHIQEIIREVKAEILDLYDYLVATRDSELGPILLGQKKHLKEIITTS